MLFEIMLLLEFLLDLDMSLNCLAVLPLPAPLGRLGARKGIRSVKTIAPKRRP